MITNEQIKKQAPSTSSEAHNAFMMGAIWMRREMMQYYKYAHGVEVEFDEHENLDVLIIDKIVWAMKVDFKHYFANRKVSLRALNMLCQVEGIGSLYDFITAKNMRKTLKGIRNAGKVSIKEIERVLQEDDLSLGMDFDAYLVSQAKKKVNNDRY